MKKTKIAYYSSLIITPKKNVNEQEKYGSLSYNKQEAIESLISIINDTLEYDKCTKDKFEDEYYYEFELYIIPSEHYEFENREELLKYCKDMIPSLNKDNLYDFLLSISDFATETYDYNGNLMYGTICIDDLGIDPEIYMTENDRGLPGDKFKDGDIVVRKNYPDDLYKIIFIYDDDFIHPEFPIHYAGSAIIAPLREYKDEDELSMNTIRYSRTELIKV